MKQDIICLLTANLILLPGELAIATFGMAEQGQLNLINFLCWVGAFMTVNFIIGGCFSMYIHEQREIAKQEERIEDA
jgi:hypothetical protein